MLDVVAHQGGWDEILMVAGPLAVFALVLWLANKRANLKLAEQEQSDFSSLRSENAARAEDSTVLARPDLSDPTDSS